MKDFSNLKPAELIEELGKVDMAIAQCGISSSRLELQFIRKVISAELNERQFVKQFLGKAKDVEELNERPPTNITDDELAQKENEKTDTGCKTQQQES